MQYWDIVLRSFQIPWRHKYLWLLAFFAGEGGGGGFNFSYRTSGPFQPRGGRAPSILTIQQQIADWLASHVGLIVAAVVVLVLVAIGLFILAAVCEGAVVRAAAEHDAERPFGLGWAWRTGTATMATIIVFRLLLLALGLPVVVVLGGVAAGFVAAIVNQNVGAAVGLGVIGFVLILATIPYLIYLSFLNLLGTRAAVLEQLRARPAIVRAHRLALRRLGRVLLVWLLSVGVGIVVGIALVIAIGVLALPAIIAGIAAFTTGSAVAKLILIIAIVVAVPIVLVVQGFVAAQASTYWTLAFRRLDIDPAPAYGTPYPQQPAPGTS
jgi:hypothetical protein